MSLQPQPTLEYIRNEVLKRCGYSTTGNQASAVVPTVDSLIRSSERELFMACDWISAYAETSVTLQADVTDVEFPDDAEKINQLWVANTSNRYFQVGWGVRIVERDSARSPSGRPMLAAFVNGIIRLYPAPTSTYPTLFISYIKRPNLLTDNDRTLVDGEVLIQAATMSFKGYLGLPVSDQERLAYERYRAGIVMKQSNGGGFQMGGHQSWKNAVQKVNRVAAGRRFGRDAPYASDWNPY